MSNVAQHMLEFILESEAIEHIYRDPEEIASQIQNRVGNGHVGAIIILETLAKGNVQHLIDRHLICEIQRLITEEQNCKNLVGSVLQKRWLGKYRDVKVRVKDSVCPPPEVVSMLMEGMIKKIQRWQKAARQNEIIYNLGFIADSHHEFLKIHPFTDGNGRTARILTWYEMRFAGIMPFVFTSHDKCGEYYPCFEPDNTELMRKYFFLKYEEFIRKGFIE